MDQAELRRQLREQLDETQREQARLATLRKRMQYEPGDLSYPSQASGWQLGDPDLGEYLTRYRGKHLVLIIAPVGDAPSPTYTCGICGFVMNEVGECPRCEVQTIELEQEIREQVVLTKGQIRGYFLGVAELRYARELEDDLP